MIDTHLEARLADCHRKVTDLERNQRSIVLVLLLLTLAVIVLTFFTAPASAQRIREQHVDTETLCVGAGCGQSFCALLPYDSTKEILLCDSTEISGYLNTNDGLKLIDGGTNISVSLEAGSASGNPLIELTNGQPQTWQFGLRGSDESFVFSDATAGTTPVTFEKACPADLLYLDSQGYVGLGTSTPGFQLHVKSTTDVSVYQKIESTVANSAAADIFTNDVQEWVSGLYAPDIWGVYDNTAATAPFTIEPGARDSALCVDSTGNVGLGSCSPEERAHVYDSSADLEVLIETDKVGGIAGLSLRNDAQEWKLETAGSDLFRLTDGTGVTAPIKVEPGVPNNALYIDANGYTDLGSTAPNERLTVEGVLSLDEVAAPTATTGYGKVWTQTDDELYFQDGGGVTHVLTPAYAEISAEDNATATTITVAGTAVQVTIFDTNGISRGATPDHTNDHITIGAAGDYEIISTWTINSAAGGGSSRADLEVKKNNGASRVGSCHQNRTMAGGGSESGAVTVACTATLAASDTIEAWITNETNTGNYVIEDITFYLKRLDN